MSDGFNNWLVEFMNEADASRRKFYALADMECDESGCANKVEFLRQQYDDVELVCAGCKDGILEREARCNCGCETFS